MLRRLRRCLGRTVTVCLALVIALALMGAGYAQINGGIQNNDVLANGSGFTWAVSNDDGAEDSVSPYGTIDPGDDGGGTEYDRWGTESSDDPSQPQEMGVPCDRYEKDVARTTAHMDGEGRDITVLVENAYPCYHPTVFFGIRGPDSFSTAIMSIVIENPQPEVLTVTTSGISVGQPIPAGEEVVGAVHVHVEQAARQNATYTFRIIITFGQDQGISLTKQASPTSLSQAGTTVTYTYTATNNGNVPLDNVTVTEEAGDFTGTGPLPVPVFVGSSEGSPEGTLQPGESATYRAEYIVTQADIDAGFIFNEATATGYYEDVACTADDLATVTTSNQNSTASCPAGGCVRLLTVDWDGVISTTCLDSSDRCLEDVYAPSPGGKHSLLLESRTRAPEVDGTRHYLITIREIEDIPPLPENTIAVAAFRMTPAGALFDRDIFLTLGIEDLPDDAADATIAYYDDVNGVWVPLYGEPGGPSGVAELTLTAALDHFTIFALLIDRDPDATRFVVSDLGISTDVEKLWSPLVFLTRVGRNVEISADVANQGRWSGAYTVVLKLNGEEIDSETVTVGAGQSREVTFSLTGVEYGRYEVEVAGMSREFTAYRTIAWWLILIVAAAIGLAIWGIAHDRKRRRARREA